HIAHESIETEQTRSRFGDDGLIAFELAQHVRIPESSATSARRVLGCQNFVHQDVHFVTRALDVIRNAIETGIEKAKQDAFAVRRQPWLPQRLGGKRLKRSRTAVTHSKEEIAYEHERYVSSRRELGFREAHDCGSQKQCPIVLIEAAGIFDLGHLLTRGQGNFKSRLYAPSLLFRWMKKVNPGEQTQLHRIELFQSAQSTCTR